MYKVTVIGGAGYVGLVTSTCLAELGHNVICYDKDSEKIKILKEKGSPIFETGVEELIKKHAGKRLIFTDEPEYAIHQAEVIFICVGTPSLPDGSPDLSYVESAAIEVAKYINGYKLIVEKSTVPVRTAQWIERTIRLFLRDEEVDFDVASNPEFLREGSAVKDFMEPDRIVIGVQSEKAKKILLDMYKDFKCPILVTDVNTAELIKHASNSFLALKISYINMIADFCEKVKVDIKKVAEGMGLDPRIGQSFLEAGVGWGGSCFPKDIKAFIKMAEEVDFSILEAAYKVNEDRIQVFLGKVKDALWVIKGKTIAILGLSFKPNTDDIRESPALKVIPALAEEGATLKLYDPVAMNNIKQLFHNFYYASDPYDACKGSHALLIITDWDEFKNLDLKRVKELMLTPIIIDGRNIYDPQEVRKLGFEYRCMGRV